MKTESWTVTDKLLDWPGLPYVLVALVGIIIAECVWVVR